MARPQVREVSAPSTIQPVAAPVNTYVRPADPARSPLHDLAEGLAAFDAGMGKFLNKRKADNDAAEAAKAEVDFNRNNQMGWAEAVRQGVVPASASPIYVKSWKAKQGNLSGLRLTDKFSLDYQKWEGRHSADSGGYAAFVAQWMAENIGDEQDPDVLVGLAPHLDRISMGGLETFMKERDERVVSEARSTTGALVTYSLEEANDEANSGGEVDWDTHWSNIMAERDAALARGDNGVAVDQLIVDSILLSAERTESMDPLTLLDRTLPGAKFPLKMDPKVREAMTKAQDRIVSAQGARAGQLAQERERREKQEHEDTWAVAMDLIHRGETVPEEMIVRLSRRDGKARQEVTKYQREFASNERDEDPEALLQVFSEIDGGAGVDYVNQKRKQGIIKDPTTLTRAYDRVKAIQNAQKDGGIFTSPTYKDTVKLITNATGEGAFSVLDGVKGLSSEGMEALYDYRQMLLDWETKNPNASLIEREKAAREAGDHIQAKIIATPGGDLAAQYYTEKDRTELETQAAAEAAMPPEAVSPDGTLTPEAGGYDPGYNPADIPSFGDIFNWITGSDDPDAAPEAAPDAAPEEVPADQTLEPEPAAEATPAPALETLSPARRSAVESLAERKGITVEEANQQLHDTMQTIIQEREEPALGVDPETTGSVSTETSERLSQVFDSPATVADAPLATAYVNPKGNPNVAAQVLDKFAGRSLPVTIRNNNMGAISITGDIDSSWAAKQPGFVGTSKRPKAEGGYYAKYATPEHGVAAASKLLEQYGRKGINTPEAIVKKWSTDTNAHGTYATTLARHLNAAGIEAGVDTPLDLTDPKVRVAVLKAKSAHESGAGVPVYADAVFERGANYRLGDSEKPTGLAALAPNRLKTSTKRGYQPDIENLKPELKAGVESLQEAWGRDLPVVSGFRDPQRNKRAGGSKKSQHQHGNAVDIDVSDLSEEDRVKLIKLASEKGFRGIGVYANSLHLDYGNKRYWGPSHGKDSLPAWAQAAIDEHMSRA